MSSQNHYVTFSATVGDRDFDLLSVPLTFPPGSKDGVMLCSAVNTRSNNLTESEEHFFVILNLVTVRDSISLGNKVTHVTFTNVDGKNYN